ncbi:unnamed protein product [Urochloa humidicola]
MKYSIDTRNYKLGAVFVSLFLSLAATIVAAAAIPCVAWYFMSKQRRWKKEMDKLTKTMQSLPGVPTQVDFADIRKATDNFHETMKLGRGGFSSVYRCRLPEAASGRTSLMEVAVKKFTREIEEQRYVDFLAEVSIINRLRHKNVVPLIGWSYNKGEPLLIYEYMTNGSLDQHLFRRNGHGEHRQHHARLQLPGPSRRLRHRLHGSRGQELRDRHRLRYLGLHSARVRDEPQGDTADGHLCVWGSHPRGGYRQEEQGRPGRRRPRLRLGVAPPWGGEAA